MDGDGPRRHDARRMRRRGGDRCRGDRQPPLLRDRDHRHAARRPGSTIWLSRPRMVWGVSRTDVGRWCRASTFPVFVSIVLTGVLLRDRTPTSTHLGLQWAGSCAPVLRHCHSEPAVFPVVHGAAPVCRCSVRCGRSWLCWSAPTHQRRRRAAPLVLQLGVPRSAPSAPAGLTRRVAHLQSRSASSSSRWRASSPRAAAAPARVRRGSAAARAACPSGAAWRRRRRCSSVQCLRDRDRARRLAHRERVGGASDRAQRRRVHVHSVPLGVSGGRRGARRPRDGAGRNWAAARRAGWHGTAARGRFHVGLGGAVRDRTAGRARGVRPTRLTSSPTGVTLPFRASPPPSNSSDGLQVVATGALRGVGDTRRPMLANLAGHWTSAPPLRFRIGWVAGGLWRASASFLSREPRHHAHQRLGPGTTDVTDRG